MSENYFQIRRDFDDFANLAEADDEMLSELLKLAELNLKEEKEDANRGIISSDVRLIRAEEARRNGGIVERRNGSDPVADLVSILDDVNEKTPLVTLESKLESLALSIKDIDPLRRAVVREAALKKLETAKLSAPARILDAALDDCDDGAMERQGRPVMFDDPEPCSKAVDGAALLDETVATLNRFVVMPPHAPLAVALWILHAHTLKAFSISPLLTISSATKRSGKTLLLEVISLLVPPQLFASSISPSALFRAVDKFTPCLLIDEADTFLRDNDELRGVVNASHRRASAFVVRSVGDEHEPSLFATWCAKAIALIGKLPGTLEDRSILVSMKRKAPGEQVEMFRADRAAMQFTDIKRKALRWAADNVETLANADPGTPQELNDRAADNWRPLLAIADLSGGEWPERARETAKNLSGSIEEGENSAVIQLLSDLHELFEKHGEKVSSSKIVDELGGMVERPWPEWKRGKPITERQLARLLKPLDVHPKQLWIEDVNVRGYDRSSFNDVFQRYIVGSDPLEVLEPAPGAGERDICGSASDLPSSGLIEGRKSATEQGVSHNSSGLADENPLFPDTKVWEDDL